MKPTKPQPRSPKARLVGIGTAALIAIVALAAIAATRPEKQPGSEDRGQPRRATAGPRWTEMKLPSGASLVESDPNDPQMLYAGVHRGNAVDFWVSRDGGNRWSRP